MSLNRISILLIIALLIGCLMCACGKKDSEAYIENIEEISSIEDICSDEKEAAEQWAKGYDLPLDEQEEKESENDCSTMMEFIRGIYEQSYKGEASNVVLNDETVLKIQNKLKGTGWPISTTVIYSDMENYKVVENFLNESMEGKKGSVVVYYVHYDGGITRMKFIFDGTDMYLVNARGIWNDDNKSGISSISYTRIKEWKYTDKGWFCYELCVPEPPEVSEIVDGSCLIRVKPMTKEQREASERYVLGTYQ